MDIKRIVTRYLQSNMYIIEELNRKIIIDPCEILCNMDYSSVDYIFLTHEHYDHISGVNYWKNKVCAPVVCSSSCAANIVDPKKNMSHHFQAFCDIQTWCEVDKETEVTDYSCEADIVYDTAYAIEWQGHHIELLSTPGHSDGSSSIIIDNQFLFSGDSLINGYETTLRFPGGNKKKWEEVSSPYYNSLDKSIMVYPGHFLPFPLSEYKV